MGKLFSSLFSQLFFISMLENSNLFLLREKLGASHEKSEVHEKRSTPVVSHQQKIEEANSKRSAIAKQIFTEDDTDSLERHSR